MFDNEKNPFMISFSREPEEYISRPEQVSKVVRTFTMDPVTDQLFMITGVRGCGKTVFMTSIANELERKDDWLVVRSTPTDVSIIDRTLEYLNKHGKKLLVTIDEVTNTPQMKEFASAFQIFIGKKYPIYFLGTGLYNNLQALKNEPNMTFLYRAPKINLGPLNMAAIAKKYQQVFDLPNEKSAEMSQLTLGYSYAFQALGYAYWEHRPVDDMDVVLQQYDDMLDEASYSKMWSELSDMDRKICHAIADSDDSSVKSIREKAGISSNLFTIYRSRLKNVGIINTSEYGKVAFALPRFANFIKERSMFYEI